MKKYITCSLFIISVSTLVLACGGSPQGPEIKEGQPDRNFDAAAQKLGISAEQLRNALGGPPPDIQRGAQILGISDDQLREALDLPGKRPDKQGPLREKY